MGLKKRWNGFQLGQRFPWKARKRAQWGGRGRGGGGGGGEGGGMVDTWGLCCNLLILGYCVFWGMVLILGNCFFRVLGYKIGCRCPWHGRGGGKRGEGGGGRGKGGGDGGRGGWGRWFLGSVHFL